MYRSVPNPDPERRGDNLTGLKDVCLKANARIRLGLSYMFRVRRREMVFLECRVQVLMM